VILGVCFLQVAYIVVAKILFSKTRVQFAHKLFQFVKCSCFFHALCKNFVYNPNFKFGDAYPLYMSIVFFHLKTSSFITNKRGNFFEYITLLTTNLFF